MKRFLSTIALAGMMVLSSVSLAFADINVSIDNVFVQFTPESGSPFIDSAGRTQVPFRATMESFGAAVSWDSVSQTAIAEKDGTKVEVPIGQNYVLKNGTRIENDTAALIKDGHTYLPIRAVLEAFGAQVNWDIGKQTVVALTDSLSGENMTIHFIDVGQGDSILIDYKSFEILIDAGPSSAGSTVVNYIKPYIDGNLDIVVATHGDADHIGGMATVLKAYRADKIIDNGRIGSTKTYNNYIAAVQDQNTDYISIDHTQSLFVVIDANISYQTIATVGTYDDSNNNSLVSMISYGDVQALFMGDAEQPVEEASLSKFSPVEILKAGHHGSSTSSSTDFLNTVTPETVIVSAATGNSYMHPHLAAMQRFARVGAKVYGTFKSGSITVTTDGTDYKLNTETVITEKDAGNYNGNGATVSTQPSTSETNGSSTVNGSAGTVTASEAAYIGNSSTKKYHLPSCKYAAKISSQNVVYLQSVPEGYEPCKICNP